MKTTTSVAMLALCAGACFAQQADPDAVERMFKHYESLKGVSVELGIEAKSDDPMMAPFLESMNQSSPGYVLKPNRFAFWEIDDSDEPDPMGMSLPRPAVYSDGETVTSAISELSIFAREDAPADFGSMVTDPMAGMRQGWQMVPGSNFLLALMAPDPKTAFESQMIGLEYEGLVGEGEKAYHAYTTRDEDGTVLQMRIAANGEPWLIGFRPDLSGSGAPEGFEMLLSFRNWKSITDAPAEGRVSVDSKWAQVDNIAEAAMAEMMRQAGQQQGDAGREPEPAVGEGDVAPDFTLDLLGSESRFSLASHRGKVVVLDFWATWCGPCIRAMPTLMEVTEAYADKGVVFAAVNLQEGAEQVGEFMENKGWNFHVPMDTDGAVAQSYGVTGIPHTVIVDKQGVVRKVKVGFANAEATAKALRADLDKLIAE